MKVKTIKTTSFTLVEKTIPALTKLSLLEFDLETTLLILKNMNSLTAIKKSWNDQRSAIINPRAILLNGKLQENPENKNEYLFKDESARVEAIDMIQNIGTAEIEVEVFPIQLQDIQKRGCGKNILISADVLFNLNEIIEIN